MNAWNMLFVTMWARLANKGIFICRKTNLSESDWSFRCANRNALLFVVVIYADRSNRLEVCFAPEQPHSVLHANARSALIYSNNKLYSLCEWRSVQTHKCTEKEPKYPYKQEANIYSCHIWNATNRRNTSNIFFFSLSKYTFFRNRK